MFFCETCRNKNDWPESLFQSRGPCEVCGHIERCHEVRSSLLPVPRTQEDMRVAYMQGVDGRLIERAERMAFDALDRALARHPGDLVREFDGAAVAYTIVGEDAVSGLAYRHWLRAHLAVKGHETWMASNPERARVRMDDRAPRLGGYGDDLALRLESMDPMVRGTALGDIARGWVA